MEAIGEEFNWLVKKLIEFKEKLLKTNKELEDLKTKIVVFKNYEGKVKNFICQNTEHNKKEECNINSAVIE